MSLFPAYGKLERVDSVSKDFPLNEDISTASESKAANWLTNSSFDKAIIPPTSVSIEASTSKTKIGRSNNSDQSSTHKHKKNKSSKSHKKNKAKHSREYHKDVKSPQQQKHDDCFYVDKKCEKGNMSVPTLYRPAIPKYRVNRVLCLGAGYLLSQACRNIKFKKYRYFTINLNKDDDQPAHFTSQDDGTEPSCHITQMEQQLSKTTGDFNRQLTEQPNNIELWMEYVQFQDSVNLFEKSYRRSGHSETMTAERKLAILDKALLLNPLSEALLKERFRIAESVFTHDQMAEDVSRRLERDPSSLTLWRCLVNTARNNMARCTVPSVLQVFSRAILRLHQLRRGAAAAFVHNIEHCILVLLLECGLFLQQAGLWEQLWTLLKLYLTLNLSLSAPDHFKVEVSIPEKQLFEKEDTVISSGLPLPTLWLRVEHLRSSVHFLPVNTSEDPQRVVFADDLSELLQPITRQQHSLLLVAVVTTLLKVPLLPVRHSTLEVQSLLSIGSSVNNVETLLAAVFPVGPVLDLHYEYLAEVVNLSLEPQWVRGTFGCTEYLTWVLSVMKSCAERLPYADSVIVHCWVLRFYRLLLRLDSRKLSSLPGLIAKQSKAYAKGLLKLPAFRDCLQLYTEYALIERELGNSAAACRILETAATLRHNISEAEQPTLTALYHTLITTLLQDPELDRNRAVSALVSLVEKQPLVLEERSPAEVKQSVVKSHHIGKEIIAQAVARAAERPVLSECFCPQLCVDWSACHAWLLFLSQSVWAAASYVEEIMQHFPHTPDTIGYVWREQLWEVLVSLLHCNVFHRASGYSVLRDTLHRAVKEYPSNLHILGTMATLETSSGCGTPWWKLVTQVPADSTLARLMLILIARSKLKHKSTGDESNYGSANRLHNLLKQSTLHTVTKKCPLIWRLYLQYVASKEDKTTIKNTFYMALEECPWVKCLYYEAAQALPEELPEIQDLLIEKQLRLHTTPEELDVLRAE